MEVENNTQYNNNPHKNKVHRVLAHGHSVFFLLFLIGVTLDFIFPIKIFTSSFMVPIGFLLLILGTLLIVWAEKSSHNFKKDDLSKETFCSGPYCYTRNPTHFGLFFLVMGFGFIANAFFVILTTLVSFFIEKFVFQSKAEKILAEKYGTHYLEYKKMVKF